MKSFTVTKQSNLKDFTDEVYPQGAFCLAALLKKRDVKVNGARVGGNVTLKAGDEVTYYTTQKQEAAQTHFTVYEDDNVYVADKFSGVTSEGLLSELCARGEFYAVHRLDRNTQGLLVFAKTQSAEKELLTAFKTRAVNKTYIALCKNAFKNNSGVLTAYLVKNPSTSTVKVFLNAACGGAKIVTQFEVLAQRGDIALVKITLHTGKTHQIRAHTAFIGCPVLGDEKYGDSALNRKYGVKRQRLIAKYLNFEFTGDLKYLNGKIFESSFMY